MTVVLDLYARARLAWVLSRHRTVILLLLISASILAGAVLVGLAAPMGAPATGAVHVV